MSAVSGGISEYRLFEACTDVCRFAEDEVKSEFSIASDKLSEGPKWGKRNVAAVGIMLMLQLALFDDIFDDE